MVVAASPLNVRCGDGGDVRPSIGYRIPPFLTSAVVTAIAWMTVLLLGAVSVPVEVNAVTCYLYIDGETVNWATGDWTPRLPIHGDDIVLEDGGYESLSLTVQDFGTTRFGTLTFEWQTAPIEWRWAGSFSVDYVQFNGYVSSMTLDASVAYGHNFEFGRLGVTFNSLSLGIKINARNSVKLFEGGMIDQTPSPPTDVVFDITCSGSGNILVGTLHSSMTMTGSTQLTFRSNPSAGNVSTGTLFCHIRI